MSKDDPEAVRLVVDVECNRCEGYGYTVNEDWGHVPCRACKGEGKILHSIIIGEQALRELMLAIKWFDLLDKHRRRGTEEE